MMNVRFDSLFLAQAKRLPQAQQRKLSRLIAILRENIYDTRLHTKKLGPPLEGQYSFRIARDWRVIFYFLTESEIFLTRVKHRKDIYR